MSVDPIKRAPLLATVSGSILKSSADCRNTSCTSSCSMVKIWLHDLPESNVTFWQGGNFQVRLLKLKPLYHVHVVF